MAVPNGPLQAPLVGRTGGVAKAAGSEDATHPSSTATGSTYAPTASDSGGDTVRGNSGSTRRRRAGRSGGGATGGTQRRGDKTSSYRGVTATDRGKAWRARIRFGSAILNIGRFDAEADAAAAYDIAAHLLFGPGAVLNFPLNGGHHAAASARDMSRLLQRALGPAAPPAVLRALNCGGDGGEDEATTSTHSAQERARKSPRAASPPEAPAAQLALPAPLEAQPQQGRSPDAASGDGGFPLRPPPRQESTNAAAAAAAVAQAADSAAADNDETDGAAVGPRLSGGVGIRFSGGFPQLPTLASDLDSLLGGLGSLSELASLDDRLAAEALGGAAGNWADAPAPGAASAAAPPPVPAALVPPGAQAMGLAQAHAAVAPLPQHLQAGDPQIERRAPATALTAPAHRQQPVTTNACYPPLLPAAAHMGQAHVLAPAPGGLPQQAAGPLQAPGIPPPGGGGSASAWPPPPGYRTCEAAAACEVVRLATARPDLVLFGLRAAADAAARGVISPLDPEDTARLTAAAESLRSLAATRLWGAFGL